MYISQVHVYKTDETGYFDPDQDQLAGITVTGILTPDNISETDILDETIANTPEGTHLLIEVYVLNYTHFIDADDTDEVDSLLATLVECLTEMLDDGSLVYLDDFELQTTVMSSGNGGSAIIY